MATESTHGNYITREAVVGDIQSVAEDLGETPTKDDYDEHGEYSSGTARNRFGSWTEAVEAAGFEPVRRGAGGGRPAIRPETLKLDVMRVAYELGRPPSRREYDEYGEHAPDTVVKRFGSWTDALESLGLETYHSGETPMPLDPRTVHSDRLRRLRTYPMTAAELGSLGEGIRRLVVKLSCSNAGNGSFKKRPGGRPEPVYCLYGDERRGIRRFIDENEAFVRSCLSDTSNPLQQALDDVLWEMLKEEWQLRNTGAADD